MKEEHIRLIKELSDPILNGRVPGTLGHETALDLILQEVEKLKLAPIYNESWIHKYKAERDGKDGQNIIAYKKGTSKGWLLLGAHYDHILGCPGADDNAAAIGILFSVFDSITNVNTELNIVLAIFDMEEPPYFHTNDMGSYRFIKNCPLRIENFYGAIILDLCGHDTSIPDRENALFAIGADTSRLMSNAVKLIIDQSERLQVYRIKGRSNLLLSDHLNFASHNLPYLFLTCGYWEHYHQQSDTFENLNLSKIAEIAEFLSKTVMIIDKIAHKQLDTFENFSFEDEQAEVERLLGIKVKNEEELNELIKNISR